MCDASLLTVYVWIVLPAATASDDGTVRLFDFRERREENVLRGHGSDVRALDWHPSKGCVGVLILIPVF